MCRMAMAWPSTVVSGAEYPYHETSCEHKGPRSFHAGSPQSRAGKFSTRRCWGSTQSPRLLRRGYFPSRLLERGKLERSRAVLDGSSGLKEVPSSRGRSATLRQGCSRGFFALFRKEGSSVQAVLAPIHSDVRAIRAIYRDFVEMNQRTSIPRRPLLSAQRVSPLTYRRW